MPAGQLQVATVFFLAGDGYCVQNQHFPPATFTGHDVLQIIRHHHVTDAETFNKSSPWLQLSRQCGMIVQ
ncbi:hypothetical protein DU69_12250 [Methanosarcina mazei]|uniref:Uncharacterized protein n=1 Tax=Methanosarcina mazei TaxID=2209 RepID=A0A0F8GK44_METMZ|nr:hypothetical protein DU33_15790 [Methanosarcina mazei]KKG65590.1 hypothetical protein DU64_15080 [Methanosarcina mazei]KKG65602.1 hypothetical protein DU67_19500 [Methanosarcina mazei]KKG81308.1 hypothetical protein DU55_19630 [Methanosarcina mazei]KKG87315.1 hypothetical protein DU69_12250 [Methanosarcina mazei]